MASTTSWDESVPSGTSSIAQGDDEIRSLKSFVRSWISQEHYTTDGSANSAGEHKLGSARVFVGTSASHLSNPASGRVMHMTVDNSLYVASASSWSRVAGVVETSRNTFTAQQNFHANAKIGTAGSAISSVERYALAVASITTIAASGTSVLAVSNTVSSGASAGPFMVGIKADGATPWIQATAYYDPTNEFLRLAISNLSGSAVTLPAQTFVIASLQFA